MKKYIMLLVVVAVLIGVSAWTAGFMFGRKHMAPEAEVGHTHQWGQWGTSDPDKNPDQNAQFLQFRHCTNCGLAEFRRVVEVK